MDFKKLIKLSNNAKDFDLADRKIYKQQLTDKKDRLVSEFKDYLDDLELSYEGRFGSYYYNNDDLDHYNTIEFEFENETIFFIGEIDIKSEIKSYYDAPDEEKKAIIAVGSLFIWDDWDNEYVKIIDINI